MLICLHGVGRNFNCSGTHKERIVTNWKTSTNGILAAIIGAAGPLTAYLATVSNPKAATEAGVVTLIASIARVWIGLLQTDSITAKPPVDDANALGLNK